jgi:hypothetical protein
LFFRTEEKRKDEEVFKLLDGYNDEEEKRMALLDQEGFKILDGEVDEEDTEFQ